MQREPSFTGPLASLLVGSLALLAVACSSSPSESQAEDALRRDASPDAGAHLDADAAAPPATTNDAGATDQDTFVDPRDGQPYRTRAFGSKRWLARNLNFSMPGSYCYDDDATQCDRDGRLYSWAAARSACAPGWHLASDAEWKTLEVAVGMGADQLDLEGYSTARGTSEGTLLKDAAGFGAHMAGFRTGGSYEAQGDRTYFWTASTRSGEVWRRRIADAEPTIFRFTNPPSTFAISVRCVMD